MQSNAHHCLLSTHFSAPTEKLKVFLWEEVNLLSKGTCALQKAMKNLKPMSYRPACMADTAPGESCKTPASVSGRESVCTHFYQCSSQDRSFPSNESIEVFHFFTQKLSSTLPLPTHPTASSVQPEIKTCMYPIMTDDHV